MCLATFEKIRKWMVPQHKVSHCYAYSIIGHYVSLGGKPSSYSSLTPCGMPQSHSSKLQNNFLLQLKNWVWWVDSIETSLKVLQNFAQICIYTNSFLVYLFLNLHSYFHCQGEKYRIVCVCACNSKTVWSGLKESPYWQHIHLINK